MADEKLELTDMQGLIARGYGNMPFARFLVGSAPDTAAARGWLAEVAPSVTPAEPKPDRTATQVAISVEGMRRLGLGEEVVAGFSQEFREGMTAAHRQRTLGDVDDGHPSNWRWGGPETAEVHAVVLLYAVDEGAMDELLERNDAITRRHGIVVHENMAPSRVLDREPFGFRDGISQPFIPGLGKTGPAVQTVKAGEFVLGYENEYGLLTDSPTVGAHKTATLPPARTDSQRRDLGRNGTYLVYRQLEQDVPGFWRYMHELAAAHGSGAHSAEYLAAKMVGRWPSGAPLVESPEQDDPALSGHNDFGYQALDEHGMRCPVGAHVRRANPRDSLDPDPGSEDSWRLNKRHRILRRGRPYGSQLTAEAALAGEGDDEQRGLHFICLAANISRQFEFIQQTWISNPKFGEGYAEVDPLIGTRGPEGATHVMPAYPVRERIQGIPSFVTVRGGAYFFMPGLRALRYLASLS